MYTYWQWEIYSSILTCPCIVEQFRETEQDDEESDATFLEGEARWHDTQQVLRVVV